MVAATARFLAAACARPATAPELPGAPRSGGSTARLLCMVGDLPERGSPVSASDCVVWGNGASVAEDETVREIAVPRVAGGALREIASQER
jgi:hypothetical protein